MPKSKSCSYILDPSYSSYRPAQPHVLVDCNGILHDPDYRLFPPVTPSSPSTSFPHRNEEVEEEYVDPFSYTTSSSSSSSRRFSMSSTTSSPSSPHTSSTYPQEHTKLRKLSAKSHARVSLDSYREEEEEDDEPVYTSDVEEEEAEDEPEKPCIATRTIKRELQSIALSMSIGVFRAKRKMRTTLRR